MALNPPSQERGWPKPKMHLNFGRRFRLPEKPELARTRKGHDGLTWAKKRAAAEWDIVGRSVAQSVVRRRRVRFTHQMDGGNINAFKRMATTAVKAVDSPDRDSSPRAMITRTSLYSGAY